MRIPTRFQCIRMWRRIADPFIDARLLTRAYKERIEPDCEELLKKQIIKRRIL